MRSVGHSTAVDRDTDGLSVVEPVHVGMALALLLVLPLAWRLLVLCWSIECCWLSSDALSWLVGGPGLTPPVLLISSIGLVRPPRFLMGD
jgi:hypothetical protein